MKSCILLFLLLANGYLFSQNLEVKYYMNSLTSDENLKKIPEELRTSFLQNTFSYTLTYSNGFSLYKNDEFDDEFYKKTGIKKNTFIHDEKVVEEDDLGNKSISTGILVDNTQLLKSKETLYYKDINNKEINYKFYNGEKTYNIIDKPFDWNWKITDETKEIAGYTCRKAISKLMGYHFEAWYTEDIPVSAGPEKFDGLPGLILYANSVGEEYIAYSIKNLEISPKIEKPVFSGKTYTFIEVMSEE
jgi:GLPGLI family protein